MQSLITKPRLAQLLRVDEDTIRQWSDSGRLPAAVMVNKVLHFNIPAVNILLQKAALGFETPPTIEALFTGKIRLLTSKEAQRKLKMGKDSLLLRVNTGRIAAIKLSHTLRVDQTSLEAYLSKTQHDTSTLSRGQAAHIFGVSISQIHRWLNSGDLDSVEVVHSRQLRPITRESVVRLLH